MQAKYPDIFKNGGIISGRIKIIFIGYLTLSQLNKKSGTYQISPIIQEIGLTILIQFITVKKVRFIEYFEYLNKQIKDPRAPMIPLKIKLLDNNGFANPKTKK